MRQFLALVAISALAACATTPDPRSGFSEAYIGNTVVTYVDRLGTQAVHMADDGNLYLWSSAQPAVQAGKWRYDLLATGAATSFQGAGGINYPVEKLQSEWGVCFQYLSPEGEILRRREGGDWNCVTLTDYEALIIDRADGDAFSLTSGAQPPSMPVGERLSATALRAL